MDWRLEETLTASKQTVDAHLRSHQRNADQSRHLPWWLERAPTLGVWTASITCHLL